MSAPTLGELIEIFSFTQPNPDVQVASDAIRDGACAISAALIDALGDSFPETEEDPFSADTFLMFARLRSAVSLAHGIVAQARPAVPEVPA